MKMPGCWDYFGESDVWLIKLLSKKEKNSK